MTQLNKYQKGQIYVLKSPYSNRFYIGSTIQPIELRKKKHYYDYRGHYGLTPAWRGYRSSFKIIDDGDYYIELLENYPTDCVKNLQIRELEYIYYYKNKYKDDCVNMKIPRKFKEEDLLYNNIMNL
jgi:hypothetical protein